jgi:hypothetical protein
MVTRFSETLLFNYQTTRRHTSEMRNHQKVTVIPFLRDSTPSHWEVWRSRGTAPRILQPRHYVGVNAWLRAPDAPNFIEVEAGWAPESVWKWTGRETKIQPKSNPDSPVHSNSIYWLSYTGYSRSVYNNGHTCAVRYDNEGVESRSGHWLFWRVLCGTCQSLQVETRQWPFPYHSNPSLTVMLSFDVT